MPEAKKQPQATTKLVDLDRLTQADVARLIDRPTSFVMQDSGEVASEVTEEQVVAAVVALLQANYVVDLPELIAIGALQESDLAMVALVSCRYERLLDWINTIQKKTSDPSTPSGEISSAGEAA